MKEKLNILILEDIPEDAELMERELRKEKISFTSIRVENKQDFLKGLKDFKPDIILSDYSLPRFNGLEALELAKEIAPDIPFIMVTGSLNEETAVECMKRGAWDYVIKEHLARLGYAVINALKLKAENDKKKQAEEALMESEEKFRNLVETSADLVIRLTKTGYIDYISPRVEDLYGYSPDELIGKHLKTTTPIKEIPRAIMALNMVLSGKPLNNFKINQRTKAGQIIPMEINSVPTYQNGKIVGTQGVMRDITERKQAEDKIRKLSIAVQQSPSVIAITDLKGNLEYVNPKFTELTGYTSEEAIGKNPRILKSSVQPDEIYKKLWKTISSGKEWRGEFHNKKKNGELFWEAASISPILDNQSKITNYIKVAEDITERKRAEQIQKVLYNISNAAITTDNLKKLISLIQKELGSIIDTTNFYVALYDHKTDMIFLPFFTDEKDELPPFPAGKTLTNYVIKTQKPLLATKEKLKKLVKSGDVEIFGTDSEIWLGVPLQIEGKVTGVLAVQSYTDENAYNDSDMEMLEFIADQVSISIERKKTEQNLICALEKATESDRLKSTFLAAMSHELRTPLNAIIGFSDLVDENLPVETIVNFCKIINSSGNHLLSIVEDLFDITLIESGEIQIVKEKIRLQIVLNDVQEIIKAEQQRTDKGNIDLNLIIPQGGKDLIIKTDSSKLKQILINLLKNALKFTHEGHIKYGFNIETDQDKPMLKFFVEDTGIGIPKEKQELIFDIFRQVEDSHTRSYGGTGIGLSIARKLTELLGGQIWIESEKGAGSTFYFTVPLNEVIKISAPTNKEAEKKKLFKEKTILIVEDDRSSFEYLKTVLDNPGINIIWVENGEESVTLCKENPNIDLVLMDVNIPVMDGYTATKKIKKFRPTLPIIAQTAHAIAGDHEKSLDAGCDDYIAKPIKKEELMKKIGKFL